MKCVVEINYLLCVLPQNLNSLYLRGLTRYSDCYKIRRDLNTWRNYKFSPSVAVWISLIHVCICLHVIRDRPQNDRVGCVHVLNPQLRQIHLSHLIPKHSWAPCSECSWAGNLAVPAVLAGCGHSVLSSLGVAVGLALLCQGWSWRGWSFALRISLWRSGSISPSLPSMLQWASQTLSLPAAFANAFLENLAG